MDKMLNVHKIISVQSSYSEIMHSGWLKPNQSVTCNIQSECFILEKLLRSLKLFYEIDS